MPSYRTMAVKGHIELMLQEIPQRIEDPDVRAGAVADFEGALPVVLDFQRTEAKIEGNPTLTPDGKQQRLGEEAQKQGDFLTSLRKRMGHLTANVEETKARLFAPPPWPAAVNEVVARLDEQEIRAWLRDQSPADRVRTLTDALEHGRTSVVRALLGDPTRSLVNQDILDQTYQTHVRNTRPAPCAHLDALEQRLEYLTTLTEHMAMWLGEFVAYAKTAIKA